MRSPGVFRSVDWIQANLRTGLIVMSTTRHPQPTQPNRPARVSLPDQWRGRPNKWAWAWRPIPSFLIRHVSHLLRFVYAIRLEGRSFVCRTRTLLAIEHEGVDLGSVLERLPSGHLIQNERTSARSCGIRELVSAHPWASNIDLQIYLVGFDAGERFAHRNSDRRERTIE
jgi:hypothetical protein